MRIDRVPAEYTPVTITLENKGEALALIHTIRVFLSLPPPRRIGRIHIGEESILRNLLDVLNEATK